MIMQPPAYKPTKGFPRVTFKGLAGTTIALGIACVIIGFAEIIYSRNIISECTTDFELKFFDDEVYPDEVQRRKKRSNNDGRGMSMPNLGDVDRGMSEPGGMDEDSDLQELRWKDRSSSSPSFDDSTHWLTSTFGDAYDMETRCAVFSTAGIYAALVYAFCGVMFIVTGSLGVGAARTMVSHRQSGLKTGYIVMNILNVLSFAPTVLIVGCVIARYAPVVIRKNDYYDGHVTTGIMAAIIGAVTTIICLVAASISCCCAPTTEEVMVISMPASPVQQVVPAVLSPAPILVDEKAQLVKNEIVC